MYVLFQSTPQRSRFSPLLRSVLIAILERERAAFSTKGSERLTVKHGFQFHFQPLLAL